MTVMLVSGLKKEKKNHYTLNRGKAVLTTGSTSNIPKLLDLDKENIYSPDIADCTRAILLLVEK